MCGKFLKVDAEMCLVFTVSKLMAEQSIQLSYTILNKVNLIKLRQGTNIQYLMTCTVKGIKINLAMLRIT